MSNGQTPESLDVGVYGVGTMGGYHARVYNELPGVDLVGVCDADSERARSVASEHDTRVQDPASLFSAVDALSITVPTNAHYDVAREAIERGIHVLVEKPFVENDDQADRLIQAADEAGVVLQVGHIERFNPAIRTLVDIVPDLDIIAVDAQRLGPPIDRQVKTSVALDLMLHDLDVALTIVDSPVDTVAATGTRDNRYVNASLTFENGVVGTFTASRLTQQKVRTLSITASDCKVDVDYIDRSVRIHRKSLPEFVANDGEVRYRHESLIERPIVENGEPLKKELSSFVDSVRTGETPVVTGEDGRRVLSLAKRIDDIAARSPQEAPTNVTN